MTTTGVCAHCGKAGLLGGTWHGRSPLDVPSVWDEACERSYPIGWTKEEIAEAAELLLAWTTKRSEGRSEAGKAYLRKRSVRAQLGNLAGQDAEAV